MHCTPHQHHTLSNNCKPPGQHLLHTHTITPINKNATLRHPALSKVAARSMLKGFKLDAGAEGKGAKGGLDLGGSGVQWVVTVVVGEEACAKAV